MTTNKQRGAPFQKGHDPRRNLSGGSSPKAKQSFKAEFRQIFEDEATPGRLRRIIRALFKKAEAGQPWAISEVLNRALGKPTQTIEARHDGSDAALEFDFLRVEIVETGKSPELDGQSSARPLPGPAPVGILAAHAAAAPADRPVADLTDIGLEAEIARLEREGKDNEPAS